jgi:hypothetical protein
MESNQRTRLIRVYLTSIRGDLFRLEDLAADIENSRPIASAAIIRELIDSIIDSVNKIEVENVVNLENGI